MQIIAPVNDATDLERKSSGGSHWSLLLLTLSRSGGHRRNVGYQDSGYKGSGGRGCKDGGYKGSGSRGYDLSNDPIGPPTVSAYHLNSMQGSNGTAAQRLLHGIFNLVPGAHSLQIFALTVQPDG